MTASSYSCPFCQTPVPTLAVDAKFCVHCGQPVAQACPYEQDNTLAAPTLIPLRKNTGPTTSCLTCGGLFNTCPRCHRLHRLEEKRCKTPWCKREEGTNGWEPTPLDELSSVFPGPVGGFDGTRTIEVGRAWPTNFQDSVLSFEGEAQAVAFRYGLLLVATQSALLCFERAASTWRQMRSVPLVYGLTSALSLLVDDGRAYLGDDKHSYTVPLGRNVPATFEDVAIEAQARAGSLWAAVIRDEGERRWRWRATPSSPTEQSPLPSSVSSISSMVGFEDRQTIVAAAGATGLLVFSAARPNIEVWPSDFSVTQVAVRADGVWCGGYNSHGAICFERRNWEGQIVGSYRDDHGQPGETQRTFLLSSQGVYAFDHQSLLHWNGANLFQQPTHTSVPGIADEVVGQPFLLNDWSRTPRVFAVRQRRQWGFQACLLDPVSAAQIELGQPLDSLPLLAVADECLIVVGSRNERSLIQTFF